MLFVSAVVLEVLYGLQALRDRHHTTHGRSCLPTKIRRVSVGVMLQSVSSPATVPMYACQAEDDVLYRACLGAFRHLLGHILRAKDDTQTHDSLSGNHWHVKLGHGSAEVITTS